MRILRAVPIRLLLAAGVALVLLRPSPAAAVPVLQLDIAGGTYDTVTETIVAPGSVFTLYALLTPPAGASEEEIAALLARTYYVSVALIPRVGPADADLGSFSIEGSTYQATSDMTYGTPPLELLEELQGHDGHDLGRHDVFETFFTELPFTFSSLRSMTYNSAETPGGLTPDPGGGTYYVAFAVDQLLLNPEYVLHFDLYNTNLRECSERRGGSNGPPCPDVDVDSFAPFSHDAQGPPPPVPEPASLLLLGAAVGTAGARRWLRRARA